jgi:hypothetical protein
MAIIHRFVLHHFVNMSVMLVDEAIFENLHIFLRGIYGVAVIDEEGDRTEGQTTTAETVQSSRMKAF